MRNRTITIKALLTENEYTAFLAKIRKSGLSKSNFIRRSIKEQEIKTRLPDEYIEVKRLLANATNNINQIAHVTNATGNIHHQQVEELSMIVDKLYAHVSKLE